MFRFEYMPSDFNSPSLFIGKNSDLATCAKLPGALPTIWCDLHGVPLKVVVDFVIILQALAAGTALGIFMFRSVNELVFRRIILIILFVSGMSLVV